MSAAPWTRDQLAGAWRDAGLCANDSVLVHSALRTLGPVDGGADAVLDSLLEVLEPGGNLMLPAFNYSRPLPKPHFDPATTAGRTGILSERARIRPQAQRSLHPTHSVVVIGPDAKRLTKDHLNTRAFGVGSPIDLLAQNGGKVLLLGVGQVSNSTIHIAEEHAQIPKAAVYDPLPDVGVLQADGSVIEHRLDSSPSCSAAFEAAAGPLRERKAIRDSRHANMMMQLMLGAQIIEIVGGLLSCRPDALLCTNPDCATCLGTRANLGLNN